MTQQKGEAEKLLEKFPFIDIIFGTHNLDDFKNLLLFQMERRKPVISVYDREQEIIERTPKKRSSFPNAWVNITYGCNNFCTYCIVPYVRGRERSRKEEDILRECREVIAEGYKEITLLGQNVNSYGKDLEGASFPALLEKVASLDGDFRLRFMTNHPKDLSEDMVKVMARYPKICHSVHLPVQSGSDRILKLMNRKYTREDYFGKIEMLKKHIPDIAVTTDIMVGFPTETEEDFNDTVDLVKRVGFSGAFTFVYSRRKGTPADKMEGQIDEETSRRRIMELIDCQNEITRKQSEKYTGETVEILCEFYDDKKDRYCGRDVYGRMAYFASPDNMIGKFVKVKINQTKGVSLFGDMVSAR